MTLRVLYFGANPETFESLLDPAGPGEPPELFVTTSLDDAIQRLRDDVFDCLLIDGAQPDADVSRLVRLADTISAGTTIVYRNDTDQAVSQDVRDLVDETIHSVATIDLTRFQSSSDPSDRDGERRGPILEESRRDRTHRIAHVDRDGTYLWVDDAMAEKVAGTRSEIIGESITAAPPDGTFGNLMELGRLAIKTGDVQRTMSSDGSGRRVVCAYPADDESFVLVEQPTDIQSILDGRFLNRLDDIVFVVDMNGNLLFWNQMLNEITGYTDDELFGLNSLDLFGEDAKEDAQRAIEAARADGTETVELPLETKDGTTIPYQFVGSVVTDSDGMPEYICGVARDISDRVQMERQVEETMAVLERSNAELEQFAYVASHDLKEPLRTIRSFLEILEDRYGEELTDDATEYIDFSITATDRMQTMIEDLLEYSRITGDVSFERVDCELVYEEAYDNLRTSIEESNTEITTDSLPVVMGDQNLLVQLFQNLIDNAIKHADDVPEVEITAEDAGDEWVIAVSDANEGMTEAEQEGIFELFSSGHDETGSGIGLSTCKKIVESHGGYIEVDSEKGVGTTFRFTLPSVTATDEEPGHRRDHPTPSFS